MMGIIAPLFGMPSAVGLPVDYLQPSGFIFDSTWTPATYSNLIDDIDFTDLTKLFQDTGTVTPVAADADPIGDVVNKASGGVSYIQATSTKRPLYRTNQIGTHAAAVFDGTDDFLRDTSGNSRSQPITVYMVTKLLTVPGTAKVVLDSAGGTGTTDRIDILLTAAAKWQVNAGPPSGQDSRTQTHISSSSRSTAARRPSGSTMC
jgi:hypothetical protein